MKSTKPAKLTEDEKELDALIPALCQASGVRHEGIGDHLLVHAAGTFLVEPVNARGEKMSADKAIARGIMALQEMAPKNFTEAMLVAQMMKVDALAHKFMGRATADGPVEIIDANVNRAVRLMRVFGEQVELLQRLQGKTGQQRMVVEHVHVHEGGQAIAGVVEGQKSNA